MFVWLKWKSVVLFRVRFFLDFLHISKIGPLIFLNTNNVNKDFCTCQQENGAQQQHSSGFEKNSGPISEIWRKSRKNLTLTLFLLYCLQTGTKTNPMIDPMLYFTDDCYFSWDEAKPYFKQRKIKKINFWLWRDIFIYRPIPTTILV